MQETASPATGPPGTLPEAPPRTTAGRTIAIAALALAIAAQVLAFLIAGLASSNRGGGSIAPVIAVLGGVGVGMAVLVVLLVGQVRRTRRPVAAAWLLAVPVIDVVAFGIALGALGGFTGCSSEDLALLRSVEPPVGVATQGEPGTGTGMCGEAVVASIPLREVLTGYRSALQADGWTIAAFDVGTAEAEQGQAMTYGQLEAIRGAGTFSISIEESSPQAGSREVSGSVYADTGT